MEEKKITPEEGMQVITQMIEASRQRMSMPNLRISIMWATLAIVTAAIVLTISLVNYTPWINLVWFAIPVIGIPVNIVVARRSEDRGGVRTAIDNISDGIWKIVGYIAIGLTIICFIMQLCGYPQAWMAMLFYAFIIVGFGAAMQGVVLKEVSYIVGGVISMLSGFVIVALTLCKIQLLLVWVLPLYIFCFLVMFIVPAAIIRNKLNSRQKCKN